jgi:hypothetical protein
LRNATLRQDSPRSRVPADYPGGETKVSHHTIDKILEGKGIRRKTLAKIVNAAMLSCQN